MKKKPTKEELESLIRDAAEKGNVTFAPTVDIDALAPVARPFFKKILNLNFDSCFISDASELSDFGVKDAPARIKAEYSIDVGDRDRVVDILRKLMH